MVTQSRTSFALALLSASSAWACSAENSGGDSMVNPMAPPAAGSSGQATATAGASSLSGASGAASVAQAGAAGTAGSGGVAAGGAGGTAGNDAMAGSAGTAQMGGSGGTGGGAGQSDERPWFSFFVTSQDGLLALATDHENGFGGDLGGLAGADSICTTLAQQSNPGDDKVWHAFLSATMGLEGGPVNAIDRIGQGPWYDYNNRLLAEDIAGLMPGDDGRPSGADAQLAEMFTDEWGNPISPNTDEVDNHDTLTGSDENGQLDGGLESTCQDWTSADAEANDAPMVGHAWPRSQNSGRHWISEHPAGGCAPGVDTTPQASNGTNTVGAGGGFGGFYCFAVSQ